MYGLSTLRRDLLVVLAITAFALTGNIVGTANDHGTITPGPFNPYT